MRTLSNRRRTWRKSVNVIMLGLTGLFTLVVIAPLIVGERVNASGSKKMRDLLEAEDWDGLVSLAKSQEREGAHILDVNVGVAGIDDVKLLPLAIQAVIQARSLGVMVWPPLCW